MCQVDCTPPGNIVIDVVAARATAGGFVQFALKQVAPHCPPIPRASSPSPNPALLGEHSTGDHHRSGVHASESSWVRLLHMIVCSIQLGGETLSQVPVCAIRNIPW